MAKKSRRKRRELAEKEKRMCEMGIEPKKKEVKVTSVKQDDTVIEKKIIDNPFVLLFICFFIAFVLTWGFVQVTGGNNSDNMDSSMDASSSDAQLLSENIDVESTTLNMDKLTNLEVDLSEIESIGSYIVK